MSPRATPALHLEEGRAGERALDVVDGAAVALLRADDERVLREDPPALFAARVRAVAAARRGRTTRATAPALALAGACAAVFLVVAAPPARESVVETVTAKGGPALVIERVRAGRAERLADGARAHTGDRLQLAIVAGGARAAVVLSIDGAGAVTLHGASSSLAARTALPEAFVLDDAPGFERFFLVTSAHDVDADAVVAAARALAARPDRATASLALPAPWAQQSVTIEKDTP